MFPEELKIDSCVQLNNGIEMPVFGLGTYLATGRGGRNAFLKAIELGYRHIDTAALYNNESEGGKAVQDSGIPRDEMFITTKLWNDDHGYEKTLRAFDASLKRLGMDYVDLYLIHWPVEGLRKESWKAMEEILATGRARSIGVSNYMPWHLEELLGHTDVVPVVDQVELSVFLQQRELRNVCNMHGIQVESYSPLTKGRQLDDSTVARIATKYGKTSPQIMIRWILQKEIIVIPKSSDPGRIQENSEVFDFTITEHDMSILDDLDQEFRTSWNPTLVP